MIIWRGWGIVALPVVLLCVFGIGSLVSGLSGDELDGVGAGIGLLIAAPATYFLGMRLSRHSSTKAAERYGIARREQLYQHIEQTAESATWRDLQGLSQEELQVRWSQQHARNWSQLEAASMAQLQAEQDEVRRMTRNQNSLFFIPVQWLWIPLVAGAAAAIIAALTGNR